MRTSTNKGPDMSAAAFDFQNKQRRDVLAGLQSANDQKRKGVGLEDGHQILLGRFYSRAVCRRLRAKLSQVGIASTVQESRLRVSLFVRYQERTTAFDLLEEQRRVDPDVRPRGIRNEYDIVLLVFVVGLFTSIMISLATRTVTLAAVFFVSALAVGWIMARCQRNRRWYGRYQISVKEIIVFTGVVAGLSVLWKLAISHPWP